MMSALEKALEQKRENAGRTYAEKVKREDYTHTDTKFPRARVDEFAGDDALHSNKWNSLMKDAAFYFDKPEVDDENKMKRKL